MIFLISSLFPVEFTQILIIYTLLMNVFLSNHDVGGYDKEDKAARAYDLAALKYWGTTTTTNFPVSSVYMIHSGVA